MAKVSNCLECCEPPFEVLGFKIQHKFTKIVVGDETETAKIPQMTAAFTVIQISQVQLTDVAIKNTSRHLLHKSGLSTHVS